MHPLSRWMIWTLAMGLAANTAVAAQGGVALEPQFAAVLPSALEMEIDATCTDQGATIRLVNRGEKWPRTAQMKILFLDDQSVISERRLRLAQRQQLVFRINKQTSSGRSLAVMIEPSWYEKEKNYDATLSCP